jgi:hypothetical protein
MAVYARRRTTVGSVIRGVGAVLALVLALHILFVLFGANAGNAFVQFIAYWAGVFALWFKNLFETGNGQVDVLLNYGIAIVFWLVITGLLGRLVDRTS